MSGRLIITGKKSYTPWNASNVERILRDERLERERLETAERTSRERRNEARIEAMKIRKYGVSANSDSAGISAPESLENGGISAPFTTNGEVQHHVNLFEKEEKKMLQSVGLGAEGGVEEKNDQRKTNCVGIMPVYLKNHSECDGRNRDCEFYKRKPILNPDVDDKVKHNMDPMKRFLRHEDSRDEPCIKLKSPTDNTKPSAKISCQSINSDDESSSNSSRRERSSKRRHKRRRHEKKRREQRQRKTHKKRKIDHSRTLPSVESGRSESAATTQRTSSVNTKLAMDKLRLRHMQRNMTEFQREKDLQMRTKHP